MDHIQHLRLIEEAHRRNESRPDDPWDSVTWEGNRRARLRCALRLTLRERLQAVEDMAQLPGRLAQMRLRRQQQKNEAPAGS